MTFPSRSREAADRLLDVFVFGPAGLALTVADELPNLAERGRHRIGGRVNTARIVGQVAVQVGRTEVTKRLGQIDPRSRQTRIRPATPSAEPAAATTNGADRGAVTHTVHTPQPHNGSVRAGTLGIPGYDSLSASQVVNRLEGLSPGELSDVRAHELANRHRQTILHRVDQLLGNDGPTGPAH